MKFYELMKVLDHNQDEITLIFPNDNNVNQTFHSINDIPIIYCNYEVTEIYGYDASGYDGIMISIVEE